MRFVFTPEEAQKTASIVAKHLSKNMKVYAEKAFSDDAPYRTTLLAELATLRTLIEAQGTIDYHRELRDLGRWLLARRAYAELYLATPEQSGLVAGVLQEMRQDGVGLIVIGYERHISVLQKARNPALIVTPEPTLKYGNCKEEVQLSLEKFNEVNRKDGLRDMCELVERETEKLALLGVRKNILKMAEKDIKTMDWATQIKTLSSPNACKPGATPIITPDLKDDLHSFTRGRNLVDHKVRGRREEERRQRQFAERMMQGPRLITELIALQRRIR